MMHNAPDHKTELGKRSSVAKLLADGHITFMIDVAILESQRHKYETFQCQTYKLVNNTIKCFPRV